MRRIHVLGLACACVLGLYGAFIASTLVWADGGTALFFIAHPDTHAEATQDNPIAVSGVQPVSFEVRIQDAGTAEKAGWQTSLLIDACEFETPSESAVVLGDMFGIGIPVRQVLPVQDDVIKLKLGQVLFPGSIKSEAGLLATVTLRPKAQRACPSGATEEAVGQIRFAEAPGTQWSAPGGIKLPFRAHPGYLTRDSGAMPPTQAAATVTTPGWPLLAVVLVALLAGAAVLAWRLNRRARHQPDLEL